MLFLCLMVAMFYIYLFLSFRKTSEDNHVRKPAQGSHRPYVAKVTTPPSFIHTSSEGGMLLKTEDASTGSDLLIRGACSLEY